MALRWILIFKSLCVSMKKGSNSRGIASFRSSVASWNESSAGDLLLFRGFFSRGFGGSLSSRSFFSGQASAGGSFLSRRSVGGRGFSSRSFFSGGGFGGRGFFTSRSFGVARFGGGLGLGGRLATEGEETEAQQSGEAEQLLHGSVFFPASWERRKTNFKTRTILVRMRLMKLEPRSGENIPAGQKFFCASRASAGKTEREYLCRGIVGRPVLGTVFAGCRERKSNDRNVLGRRSRVSMLVESPLVA